MYYIEDDGNIVLYNEQKTELQKSVLFLPQYQDLEIKRTSKEIIE